MGQKTYAISPAKIGNQDGFQLPCAFSKGHPKLVNASGEVEVLEDQTLLVRLDTVCRELEAEEEESLSMGLFWDFLMKGAMADPASLAPYTEEMGVEMDELLAGVTLE